MLKMDEAQKALELGNVKLVSLSCVSNVLGTITPYEEMVQLAHKNGTLVMLDAAQLAPHAPIDVQEIDCDFLVLSGHKIYGPTGIGVLYGKEELLSAIPPFLGGGTMIREVFTDRFTEAQLPEKFEAGTPPIAEARGLHAALEWIENIGWKSIQKHEKDLLSYSLKKLSELPFIKIIGIEGSKCDCKRIGCISFTTPPVHPHDLTEFCGRKGVCMRAGHHCAQPLHDHLGISATTRLSIGIYNTKEDIDRACRVIEEAYTFFRGI